MKFKMYTIFGIRSEQFDLELCKQNDKPVCTGWSAEATSSQISH